jgi:hypothetical protein
MYWCFIQQTLSTCTAAKENQYVCLDSEEGDAILDDQPHEYIGYCQKVNGVLTATGIESCTSGYCDKSNCITNCSCRYKHNMYINQEASCYSKPGAVPASECYKMTECNSPNNNVCIDSNFIQSSTGRYFAKCIVEGNQLKINRTSITDCELNYYPPAGISGPCDCKTGVTGGVSVSKCWAYPDSLCVAN